MDQMIQQSLVRKITRLGDLQAHAESAGRVAFYRREIRIKMLKYVIAEGDTLVLMAECIISQNIV